MDAVNIVVVFIMNKKKTDSYHHGDLRSTLIEAAVGLIESKGFDALTFRGLGQVVGVSRTAPYRHFKDKNDLICAIAVQGFVGLSRALSQSREANSDDNAIAFSAMGHSYIDFALENPAHYRLMFGEHSVSDNPTDQMLDESKIAFEELKKILQACQQINFVLKDNVDIQAAFVWSSLHGYCTLLLEQTAEKKTKLLGQRDYIINSIIRAVAA